MLTFEGWVLKCDEMLNKVKSRLLSGKKIILILLLHSAFYISNCFAQTMFVKTFGDAGTAWDGANSVKQTSDNGYIIAGAATGFGVGQEDVILVRTDANGSIIWSKTYGGTGSDAGEVVIQTSDGGFIVAGTTNSFGAGDSDVYVIRTNPIGDTLWTKTYGGINKEQVGGVMQTNSGGFIIAGSTKSFGSGNWDVYVICTDANGDTLWTKTYGGTALDRGNSIQLTTDGGYIITGETKSFGSFFGEAYLLKINSLGNVLWSKTFYFNTSAGGQHANSVKQTTDGGYIIIGDALVSVIVFKTDASGNLIWGKYFILGPEFCEGKDVVQAADGGYVITATERWFPPNYIIVLAKLDTAGILIWSESFTPLYSSETSSLSKTNDGGYVIAGQIADGLIFSNDFELCLIKTNANGSNGCESPFSVGPANYSITTDSGCIVSATQTVSGNSTSIVSSPSMITVSYCFTTNIHAESNSACTVSPNPATNELRINPEYSGRIESIEIYNVLGTRVNTSVRAPLSSRRGAGGEVIDVSSLSPGIYFVKVKTKEGISVGKFVKE